MLRLLAAEIDGEPIKRESPDFVIKLRDGRSVGVEVVRALDEQLARGRGTRTRIKRQLRDALTKRGINAWVNVSLTEGMAGYLNGEPELLRRELDAIAALAGDVAGKLGETWLYYKRTSAEFDELGEDEASLEGTGVGYVRSVAFLAHEEPLVSWSTSGAGQPPSIVQDAIDDKAEKLVTYQQCGADEVWLLVVGSSGTGGALFVDDVEGRTFTSPYDRTLFLELYEGKCVALDTTPPAAPASPSSADV